MKNMFYCHFISLVPHVPGTCILGPLSRPQPPLVGRCSDRSWLVWSVSLEGGRFLPFFLETLAM